MYVLKQKKTFIFCRSYGQKIAVMANGEKGDISEIVEKLAAYLATQVRNKQDWLLVFQYEMLMIFQHTCRATWNSSYDWPPPWLQLRLYWASGRRSWRRLACPISLLSSGPMAMRSQTRRTCGNGPSVHNDNSQMYVLKVSARELRRELLHDWGQTSWNVHWHHRYLGLRRGAQLGTPCQTDSCELFLSNIAIIRFHCNSFNSYIENLSTLYLRFLIGPGEDWWCELNRQACHGRSIQQGWREVCQVWCGGWESPGLLGKVTHLWWLSHMFNTGLERCLK